MTKEIKLSIPEPEDELPFTVFATGSERLIYDKEGFLRLASGSRIYPVHDYLSVALGIPNHVKTRTIVST